ncbi:ABC transporter permease [Ulvibacterium marinum]|uniref:ABC transporter permease n=1 Tax=Ulvibacterium marinum TaxID=2419782 RepID=UPI0024959335|nr:ABC transporter permease [Ulvibacterium marinum]
MLKHHLFLFFRNIKKNKSIFLINTVGLGIGIASFLVLAVYVYNDLTYNHFNTNLSNIYRIREGESFQTKGPLLPKILEDIPEVENGTRVFDWDGYRLSYGEVAFEENLKYVDNDFFSIFTFPFVEGSAINAIQDKFGVVISTDFAKKYFGDTPALGKQFQVKFEDVFLTVNGVVDIPRNSSIQFDIVASYETGETISPWIKEAHDWYNTFSESYVLLAQGTDLKDVKPKLQTIVTENFLPVGKNETDLNLFPFADYHSTVESNRTLIVILALVALGILGIAIVNFINLTITNSLTRTKEIGIKKVFGATGNFLFRQIMTESMLMGLGALCLGIILTLALLPTFNGLFETNLSFNPWENPFLIYVLLGIWLIVGIFSGIVPSLVWARGKLVDSLQGKLSNQNKPGFSKYSSIVVQFVIAIVLISGTFLIRKQINYMIDKDPKFDSQNSIVAQTDYWQYKNLEAASQNLEIISKELEATPYVATTSFTGSIPGDYDENYNTFYPEAKSSLPNIGLRKSYVGKNYFKTMGISVLSGHGFDQPPTSLKNTVVLNRTAMNKLGFEKAEGQIIRESSESGQPYRIIGVIDDFSYQGSQHETQPLAHFYSERENFMDWDYLVVRAEKGASSAAVRLLQEKWKDLLPEGSLTHFFADNKLNAYYTEYKRVNTLITCFSALAIILSCIGLFALASYAMARRTKEIGIRKVNGATITQILSLLNKDFLKWVVLAFLIAVPLAWYGLEKWLEGFAYKTTMSWWIFALAGLITLSIALLTVSWQSFRAATANPVEALREE